MKIYMCPNFKEMLRSCVIALYFLIALLLMAFLCVKEANAKTVYYGSGTEQIRIKHGGPTIFRFSKAVQTITGASHLEIKPANAADPSYTVLSVTPRFTNGINEVSFFLADASVIRTKILVSPNDPAADSLYDFKSEDMTADNTTSENTQPLTEVELLKSMVRDAEVSGYSVSHVSDYRGSHEGVSIELIRIYKGSPFNGYVFKLTNTSSKSVDVDVRHITVGEPSLAILSQSDEAVLLPKGKGVSETLVRVVAKNTSSSRDVVLAMEPEDPKAAKKEEK